MVTASGTCNVSCIIASMKHWMVAGLVGVVLVVVLAAVVVLSRVSIQKPGVSDVTMRSDALSTDVTISGSLATGRYAGYSEQERARENYSSTILFFYAPWCVECRGFEKAINDSEIPDGVQILKVDYDSSKELRKQYGVTIQSTFVRVSSAGEKQTVWVGYGKDKTVDAIIKNTQ